MGKDLVGLDIKCAACRHIYHETTEFYNPDEKPNGTMLRLKEKWRRARWSPFGDGLAHSQACKKHRKWYTLTCPGCGGYICGGKPRLLVIPRPLDNSPVIETYTDEQLEKEWNRRTSQSSVEETRDEKVHRLRGDGLSYAKIGEQVGLSGVSVGRILKK